MGIARLRDDLDNLIATNPSLAERLQAATDGLRDAVRETVAQALTLYGREEAENLRNEILRNAPLSRIEPRQVDEMRALIRRIARRLRERYSKPRKRQRRGHLDVRRTLRRNAAWGSIPLRRGSASTATGPDRGAVRRLGLGGAGVGFLPAADPQPA